MKVYLAGPINGTSWEECYRWRSDAADLLAKHGMEALDGMFVKQISIYRPVLENLIGRKGCKTEMANGA